MTHFEKFQKAPYGFLSTGKQEKNQEKSWVLEVPQIFICKKNWEDSLTH